MKTVYRTVLTGALLTGLAASALAQETPAEFYKGKTLTMIVASSAGGGYNAYGRTIAKHIVKHIPGNPTMIVKNMPGAGGRKATAFVANVSPKDGTVILGTQPGALVEPVLGDPKKIKYDPSKFGYVGSAAGFTTVCLVRSDLPVKTFADLQKTEVIFGGDQLGSTTHDHANLFRNVAGAKIKLVKGYKGTKNLVLAIQQKEIGGFCGYAWASLMSRAPHLVKDKVVNLIVQYGLSPHPAATKAGLPPIWDYIKDPEKRKIAELIAAQQVFGRPYITAAGVPADRLAALRAAFDATMKDPEFLADMKKSRLDVSPTSGAEFEGLVQKMFKAPAGIQKKARAAISK
ncbi:MAG: Bug family tripartite tricarboxylate transporter substrate binding protein [Alphaproteobacteria bacterium]